MENQRLKFVQDFIGMQFTGSPSPKVVSAGEKSVELEFTVRKEMTNPVGMLHGGVICGMIDECMGINLNVDFLLLLKKLKWLLSAHK